MTTSTSNKTASTEAVFFFGNLAILQLEGKVSDMKHHQFTKYVCNLCILLLSLCMLAGCGTKEGGEDGGQKSLFTKKEEHPEDTPWNHGANAIMETELGYYGNLNGTFESNLDGYQALRFYDKETGKSILLCNKPECAHTGGDTCVATYKNMYPINSVLYEGAIYELAVEKDGLTYSINLYRIALDGSSIDQVASILSAENVNDQEVTFHPSGATTVYNSIDQRPDYSFIIHKGYAYVPYYLRFGKGMMGIQGAGLKKVELTTGKVEDAFQIENMTVGMPSNLTAIGDSVYFLIGSSNGNAKTKRYDVTTGEVESIQVNASDGKGNVKKIDYPMSLFTAEHLYELSVNKEGEVYLIANDPKTGDSQMEDTLHLKITEGNQVKAVFLYDEKVFLGDANKAWFYDMEGNLLASIEAPKEVQEALDGRDGNQLNRDMVTIDYKINDGKLYYIFYDMSTDTKYQQLDPLNSNPGPVGYGGWNIVKQYHYYSCPLEDLFQGKGEWTNAFVTQGR